jgi:hypothetical protein
MDGRVPLIAIVATVVAGVSAGSAGAQARCELLAADTLYLRDGPVYRDCAVDRRASLVNRGIGPDLNFFLGSLSPTEVPVRGLCFRIEFTFVVDTTGAPEDGTARVVRSSDPRWTDTVLRWLPMWIYRPALKGGVPVRQVVRERRSILVLAEIMRGYPGQTREC